MRIWFISVYTCSLIVYSLSYHIIYGIKQRSINLTTNLILIFVALQIVSFQPKTYFLNAHIAAGLPSDVSLPSACKRAFLHLIAWGNHALSPPSSVPPPHWRLISWPHHVAFIPHIPPHACYHVVSLIYRESLSTD